jgi:hypothetical protein
MEREMQLDGKPITEEEFAALSEADRQRIQVKNEIGWYRPYRFCAPLDEEPRLGFELEI